MFRVIGGSFIRKLYVLGQKAKMILQRDGLVPFVKRCLVLFVKFAKGFLFKYRTYYIYENILDEGKMLMPIVKVQNAALRIIYTPAEVDESIAAGFDFDSYPDLEDLKEGLSQGAILFCVFIGRELVHTSWVAVSNKTIIYDPLFQRINYQDTGYIGPCNTIPMYRGLGIYPYVLLEVCKFLKKRGRSKALINTRKDNLSSIRGITKAQFRICSRVRYLKLLLWEFWKENPIKETNQ